MADDLVQKLQDMRSTIEWRAAEEITRLRSRVEELESACANAHDQLCLLAKDPANNPWCKELREVLKARSVLNNTQNAPTASHSGEEAIEPHGER